MSEKKFRSKEDVRARMGDPDAPPGWTDGKIVRPLQDRLDRGYQLVKPPPLRDDDYTPEAIDRTVDCACPDTDPMTRARTYTVARFDLEPHAVTCPRHGFPK